ncbi:probable disease resistance protein isoform X1 [Tanacetum coccineum]
MHDLARAFVLSNFSKVKQASVVNHDDMAGLLTKNDKSYERILLMCKGMSEFPADFNYPNLSLLILTDGDQLKFLADFYERMKKLEVVSFENMHTPLLPTTFEHSNRLQTLCLRSCSLMDDLSFLGTISNLEILSFAGCKIKKLPLATGKLRNLKLLDLTKCGDFCIDDGVFQKLVTLEELYMRACAIKFTDANCDELEILSKHLFALEMEFFENKPQPKHVSLKKLKRFRISIGCRLEDHIERYIVKNTLRLVADSHKLLEFKISELFEKTEELFLQVNNMNHLGDVSMHLSQHSFCNLRILYVRKCPDMTYLFTHEVAIGLKKLESFRVGHCPLLDVVVGGNRVVSGKELISSRDDEAVTSILSHKNNTLFPHVKYLALGYLPCLKRIGGTGDMPGMSDTTFSGATSVNNQFQVYMLSFL